LKREHKDWDQDQDQDQDWDWDWDWSGHIPHFGLLADDGDCSVVRARGIYENARTPTRY
jgi:hypothetical protein